MKRRVGRAERGVLIAREWEVSRRGVEREVVVDFRRVGRSGWVLSSDADSADSGAGLVSEGEEIGGLCWLAKARSSSAALVCQWKAVRESRAMKDSGR